MYLWNTLAVLVILTESVLELPRPMLGENRVHRRRLCAGKTPQTQCNQHGEISQ